MSPRHGPNYRREKRDAAADARDLAADERDQKADRREHEADLRAAEQDAREARQDARDHQQDAREAAQDLRDTQSLESTGHLEVLTARQRELLALIADGLSNEEIAERLHIGMNTVKSYIRAAYRGGSEDQGPGGGLVSPRRSLAARMVPARRGLVVRGAQPFDRPAIRVGEEMAGLTLTHRPESQGRPLTPGSRCVVSHAPAGATPRPRARKRHESAGGSPARVPCVTCASTLKGPWVARVTVGVDWPPHSEGGALPR